METKQVKVKRRFNIKPVLPSLISIVIGMFIGVIVLFISNPSNATEAMIRLFKGPFNFGLVKGVGDLLYYSAPILLTGLSVGFAFKTGLFNIGASGQFIVGAFVAVYIAIKWTFIPAPLLWIVALLAAALVGALWAFLVGLLKAWRNVNEVITSIMMNYIGMYMVNFLIRFSGIYDSLRNQTQRVKVTIPSFGLDTVFPGSFANGGIVIAIVLAIVMYIILNKTTFGFELKAVGLNRFASRYAGVNENRSIIYSMLIAGALSGIAGGITFLASTGRHITVVNVLAAEGFNGIAVALLGLNNPIGIIFSSMFMSYIKLGGQAIQTLGFVPEIIELMIAIILYISALSVLFNNLLSRRKSKKEQIVREGPVVNE
ncbi:MAG TPA: ABC transporter permease [Erysipelothrix sp.]|jgi:simple sugar transport system permease protein|nr:ABC transporter permease [Erysipelothrix sp.]